MILINQFRPFMLIVKKNRADKFSCRYVSKILDIYAINKILKNQSKKLTALFIIYLLSIATSAKAGVVFDPLSSYTSIDDVVGGVTNWVLGITAGVTVLFLIVGGIYYITAAGDEKQMGEGKKIVNYAIIGLIVILISYSVVLTLNAIIFD